MEIAHTKNRLGHTHDLVTHLRATSKLAADFATPFGAEEIARLLGLWHDLGKFHPRFQRYLATHDSGGQWTGPSPDHKAAGAYLASTPLGVAAMAIQGHHGGLKTPQQFRGWLSEKSRDQTGAVEESLRLASAAIPDVEPQAQVAPPPFVKDSRSAEFFLRLLFSCLVDADFLDTESHFDVQQSELRGNYPSAESLWQRFSQDQEQLMGSASLDSTVNRVRSAVFQHCLEAAEQPPGMFRLAVPTGGGKTRSVMAFALKHALRHGLDSVIVAVPFISITEQTASVYRSIFEPHHDSSPVVLEHHSAAYSDDSDEGNADEQQQHTRLASENWDAPIVVTTTVQLFESLFSNRVSKARKVHNLARSVIVLDEAQGLPARVIDPILDALRQLCENYGATVVLSTATQPAFESIPIFRTASSRDIVPRPSEYFQRLKRVAYEWRLDSPLQWGDLAAEIADARQALCIMNTKKSVMDLLAALDSPDALHLSTDLCGRPRKDVIDEVTRRLRADEPCHLVSTQVVEAGVDLDFPVVFRAHGPLDSIIQAAGRCNREGRLDVGRLVVFQPAEESLPRGQYTTATQTTRALVAEHGGDIDDPAVTAEYFRRLFGSIPTDREQVQALREKFDYPEVAARFRMIEDDTDVVVITDYGSTSAKRQVEHDLEALRSGRGNQRMLMRRLQPYIVNVRSSQMSLILGQGLVREVGGGVWEWLGNYDRIRGIGGAAGISADSLVV